MDTPGPAGARHSGLVSVTGWDFTGCDGSPDPTSVDKVVSDRWSKRPDSDPDVRALLQTNEIPAPRFSWNHSLRTQVQCVTF